MSASFPHEFATEPCTAAEHQLARTASSKQRAASSKRSTWLDQGVRRNTQNATQARDNATQACVSGDGGSGKRRKGNCRDKKTVSRGPSSGPTPNSQGGCNGGGGAHSRDLNSPSWELKLLDEKAPIGAEKKGLGKNNPEAESPAAWRSQLARRQGGGARVAHEKVIFVFFFSFRSTVTVPRHFLFSRGKSDRGKPKPGSPWKGRPTQ